MGSTKTDEALEAIYTAFAGVFWGRARSQDGSEEVVGASQDACKESSVEILRRKMHEKLGKARAQEAQAIREELQRMTSMANITRMKLMANVYNQEAASITPRTIAT